MTDSANADKTGMSNTLLLGLMMGGAVALVILVAVFVYIKTNNRDDDEDDDMDPVLRTARHDHSKGTAQSSTLNANYHENHNIQIALAHSQMSLPPMAQSHASSQYSQYSAVESSFYGNSAYSSAYSANPSNASEAVRQYPGMRKGKGENDIMGSEDEESDFEGDSIQDMSHATNDWGTAGRNRGGTAASGMDQSMAESRFQPSDSRSTSASEYNGKDRFQESEYTEYRMSTGYESSYAGGNSGYDKSFATTQSGFAASKSGYDSRYADGKSFQSSGFSEYENAIGKNSATSGSDSSSFYRGKESRFTDASYY
ncbi:hypothetical protein PHMEG_00013959 [Phytophthora megakarya]|uniref:Uncharacterized protein n=1 Tax=Phytophthora megakarya TaxID=4795 RepID=A0A225W751_9STRA|nr:hypothetical protein PHMEG_00013959 [Phytophthora megakarya]